MNEKALRLVDNLVDGVPVPVDLVQDVDPFDLAVMVLKFLKLPKLPGVDRLLLAAPSRELVSPGAVVPGGTPATVFVRAVAQGDPAALLEAAGVDRLALAMLAVAALATQPVSDPFVWLDAHELAALDWAP